MGDTIDTTPAPLDSVEALTKTFIVNNVTTNVEMNVQ